MPSPNGYLDSIAASNIFRNWMRLTLNYDSSQAPWTNNGGGYTFRVETATSAGGPFTLATTTGPTECSASPGNPVPLVGLTQTVFGVGAPPGQPGALNPGTQYWIRVTVLDPVSTQVDQWVQGPFITPTYPNPTPLPNGVTTTTADVILGYSAPGRVNLNGACDTDQAEWEISTTSGGPYTVTPYADVTSLTPGHQFTGLTPNTNYFWRARLRDENGFVYYQSPESTFRTLADAPAFAPTCAVPADPAAITSTSASVSGTANGVPADHSIRLVLSTTAGGPYTAQTSPGYPGTTLSPQNVAYAFTGLTAATTYYFRTEVRDAANVTVQSSTECTFTTDAATQPPFDPTPCADGGAGAASVDVENVVLCDLDAEGNLLGTALAVYEYDATGNPSGPPTFVDPATGNLYVPQGTLQTCPEGTCLPPMQFCQTETTTGPVEHPGRQYDITLPINPGFEVTSLQVDAVTHAAGIVWNIDDQDGAQFATDLTAFMEGRLPAAATVTITNPNAGLGQVCGAATPMQVHVECLRLDQTPPDLIELIYNGGQDLVQNPAYNETPPLNPPVSQGNYGFHLLARQDDPGPFPGNPPAGRANCTSVANRGWETNDVGRTFEIWGKDQVDGQGVTPTPRGTPVQEMTSDGPPPGGRSTIWQTFVAPASANFIIRVVHGSRDAGEEHRITLDNGDTNDSQNGDLIDDVTFPPSVTNAGGPNPWTTFTQTIPLNGGSTYTLALSSTNPVVFNRGGLFTDMRAYIDRPGLRATAVTNDDTCVVTTEETSTNTVCSFWQPQCVGGTIAGWQKVDTGETFTNAEFWAQVPAPECCKTEVEAASGGSALSNMLASDLVCVQVNGVRNAAIRYVVTDPSGGVLQESFISTDGTPLVPTSWTPGACSSERFTTEVLVCESLPDGSVRFIREATSYDIDVNNNPRAIGTRYFQVGSTTPYTPVGDIGACERDAEQQVLCDQGTLDGAGNPTQFLRSYRYTQAGTILRTDDTDFAGAAYVPVGPVGSCGDDTDSLMLGLCLGDGTPIGVVYHRDGAGAPVQDGWINLLTGTFSAGAPPVGTVACGTSRSIELSGILCDVSGGTTVNGVVLVQYEYNPDGSIASTTLLNAVTGTPYGAPVGTITVCPSGAGQPEKDMEVLCDLPSGVPFIRDYARNAVGAVTGFTDYTLAGAAYVLAGTAGTCTSAADTEVLELCDVVAGVPIPFLRRQTYGTTGNVVATVDTTPAGAPYVVAGTVAVCTELDAEVVQLCDFGSLTGPGNGPRPFLRRVTFNTTTGLQVGTGTTNLDGSAYTPTGPEGACGSRDTEVLILCDANGTRFVQSRLYNEAGAVVSITNTTLAGAAFAPVGAVSVCAQTVQADTDFVEEVMHDSNNTCFIRLFRFNSVTGALVSTTNTDLNGAAFAPVGTVSAGCPQCCPITVAEVCLANGHPGAIIRNPDGTLSRIDTVTGLTFVAADIVSCDPVETVSAQARTLTNATPWTPGADVVGTLTSLTVTGTGGLWDMVDQSGTALTGLPAGLTLTWTAEDPNTLSGPQSITPQAGATVVAHWTQR